MRELPLRDRAPTGAEIANLILALSTFCDGSGQVVRKTGEVFPGWRDFERCTAEVFEGYCPENKGVFDVWIPTGSRTLPYGLSCKTSSIRRDHILMELHNSNAKAHDELETLGIDWESQPNEAGAALVSQVCRWHLETAHEVDVGASSYLVLTHNSSWSDFELFWYGLDIDVPDPEEMTWYHRGRRIEGWAGDHRYWEWYGKAGGQLKYYPPFSEALWRSGPFQLRMPPEMETPLSKAARYWPEDFILPD